MITDWRGTRIESLLALHNATFGSKYEVTERVFRANTIESPLFDWGASLIDQDDGPISGFVAFKRPTKAFRVADQDAIHLSTFGFSDPEVGFRLFAAALSRVRDRGFSQVIFGAEVGHFWPGVPQDDPAICRILELQSFAFGGEFFDLERDLENFENPRVAPADAEFRRLTSGDRGSLDAFLQKSFPGRWWHDVMPKAGTDVFGLLIAGEVRGFAMLQNERTETPIGGGVWLPSLGAGGCALGPIGVAEELRGRGYGGALLGAALDQLKSEGGRRCLIDWTTLADFYGKFGFLPTRRYKTATIDLDRMH